MKIGISKTWKTPKNIENQCFGVEWPRRSNIAFNGDIDVGGASE